MSDEEYFNEDEKLVKYLALGITLLVGIGYLVFLVVLYARFMETDEYLRNAIRDAFDRDPVPGYVVPDSPADIVTEETPEE